MLFFLTKNGVSDYEELAAGADAAGKRFDFLSDRMKQLEGRMAEVVQLKMHIISYSETRDVYSEYKKSQQKNKFRAKYAEEIEKHEAAKVAFDALKGKQNSRMTQLSAEYVALLAEKKARYEEYKTVRKEMIDHLAAKNSIDKILGLTPLEYGKEKSNEMQL